MLAESLRRVDIRPQSNFLNVDDASTSVTKGLKNEENYTYFMGQTFINLYPNINCSCSTNKEIENIIRYLKLKNLYRYDEISPMIL
jgi:hypothetical protein